MYSLGYGPNGKVACIQKDGELYVQLIGDIDVSSESNNAKHYQEFLKWNSKQGTPLDLNSTIVVPVAQPPHSTILAKVKSIKVTNPKKVVVTRTWNGQDYDVVCRAVSQTIVDSYTAGNLVIGDYVLLTYCEHDYPDQPIITHKVVVL